ncbi:DUF4350 domain-containing protein [Halobellus inordinatus]|uniref:DUF4350 domain-containing protein n=1 Tax=Halobellus inordinatus TaxID=1126236 RepID=UPI0021141135|nr:DUF4350 domain-containing protein [Halobellus ramosii]
MDLRDLVTPQALLLALVGVLIAVMLVTASTSAAAFSVFNPSWDGASGIQSTATEEAIETRVALSTAAYGDVSPAGTTALIIGPDETYTESELTQVRQFVAAGGTLVVADDFGSGNQILTGIGAETRFDRRLLRDPQNNGPSTAMPTATVVPNASETTSAETVMLNYGTVLTVENATVLARSSEFSYLDRDTDGEIDENESLQSSPVIAREELGSGTVIVVSDGSLFINAMLERADNQAFTTDLLTGSELVLLDSTHTSSSPPLQVALVTLRTNAWAQVAITLLLGVLGYLSPRLWRQRNALVPQSGD